MKLSLHYYALQLGSKTSRLYEGFRDTLIDIQDDYFPFGSGLDEARSGDRAARIDAYRAFMTSTDTHFDHFFVQDPLWLVLVGKRKHLDVFGSVSLHGQVVIGEAEGDYSAVSARDLGKIVWPIVKKALAGANEHAVRTLTRASETRTIIQGLDAVDRTLRTDTPGVPAAQIATRRPVPNGHLTAGIASLFVDEDYQVKGDLREAAFASGASPNDDTGGVLDDAVDVVIEKVLARGGDVVFLDTGAMIPFQRIALITRVPGSADEELPGLPQDPSS